MSCFYANRTSAGRSLTPLLEKFRETDHTIVLGLPRGGVPVAREVARMLGLPMDVLVVRKITAPMSPEFAIGAVASGNVVCLDIDAIRAADLDEDELATLIEEEKRHLAKLEATYRQGRPAPDLAGQNVILIDDGMATGFTMKAATEAAKQRGASVVVAAVPVAPAEAAEDVRSVADEVICAFVPPTFYAIGEWYSDFRQVSEAEVCRVLKETQDDRSSSEAAAGS